MSRTGRPRIPVEKHKLRGTYKECRHGGKESTAPKGPADCPAWVLDSAREYWDDIQPMLTGMGIMSPAYSASLSLLVNSLARYVEFEQKVDETGPVSVSDKGNEMVNPWWAARNKAWDQVMKACREFGLSPSAASGVAAQKKETPERDGIAGKLNPKLVG